MEEKQYMVTMEWAKFEDSIFKGSHTGWYYAESSDEAEEMAKVEHGHNPDFEIKSCY